MFSKKTESPLFKHFILTRFNLPFSVEHLKKDKLSKPVCDSDWMRHRFDLFERYCLPSIKNQTCQNFEWLVFFSEHTADEDRKRIEACQKKYPRLIPDFMGIHNLVDVVRKRAASVPYLITTRLDNDDALRRDAVAVTQAAFKRQSFEFVNFQKGYKFDLKTGRFYPHQDEIGHFMTLIEKKRGNFKTVFLAPHQEVGKHGLIKQLSGGRYWAEVIHDRNLINEIPEGAAPQAAPLGFFERAAAACFEAAKGWRREALMKSFCFAGAVRGGKLF